MKHPDLDYSNPVSFTFRQRLSLALIAPLVALAMRALFATCRMEVRNAQYPRDAEKQHGCVLLVLWHEVLPLAVWRYRNTGCHALVSYSYDGELVARVVALLGIHSIRGSSSRGGADAVKRLTETLRKRVTVALTPDGPRGPRRRMKAGAAVLSARTGVPVIPVGLAVTRCWRMKSWDRMVFPKPFSKIMCCYGEPVGPCRSEDETTMEAARLEIERALNAAQESVEGDLGMRE